MSSKSSLGGWVVLMAAAIAAGAVAGFVAGTLSGRAPGPGGAGNAGAPAEDRPPSSSPSGDAPVDPENPYAQFRVAEFKLVDQDGQGVTQSLFEGEVTALTFFFTSCAGPCPELTKAMKSIQERTVHAARLGAAPREHQRGRVARHARGRRAFAEGYGADFDRWTFMTGDPEQVRDLVTDSIGFDLREQPEYQIEGPDGVTMNNILHPTRILLIGPDRRVIGVYWFNDPDAVTQMVRDAMAALG
jgi:protein SCO1/2